MGIDGIIVIFGIDLMGIAAMRIDAIDGSQRGIVGWELTMVYYCANLSVIAA